jgi:5-methylcytosine-specific restriction endonuclease McrA
MLHSYRPLRSQSEKAKAIEEILREARFRVFPRDGWKCQARIADDCNDRAEQLHHVRSRARGGSHEDENLLSVCRSCHQWITHHPAAATELGLLK